MGKVLGDIARALRHAGAKHSIEIGFLPLLHISPARRTGICIPASPAILQKGDLIAWNSAGFSTLVNFLPEKL